MEICVFVMASKSVGVNKTNFIFFFLVGISVGGKRYLQLMVIYYNVTKVDFKD